MKIGIFTDAYLPLPTGVATAVDRTARALEKRGHEVTIIAPSMPGYIDTDNHIYRLPSVRFLSTGSRAGIHVPNKTFLQILNKDFDIVHAYNGGSVSLLAWEIAKAKRIPYVFTYCTLLVQYKHYLGQWLGNEAFMRMLSRVICNYSDYLIVPTEAVKHELIEYGVTKPMHAHPTGIELNLYKGRKKGWIRKQLDLEKDTKILLHVGRLGKEKAIDFIIDAFGEIQKKVSNSVLVLVGEGTDKDLLQDQIDNAGLHDKVHFLGVFPPEELPNIYTDADLFLFASQTETQGLVILESLASSLPIVAVQDKVFNGILVDGKNSYLVKKDVKQYTAKVVKLLTDEKLRQEFADQSLQSAQQFSIEKTAIELETIFEELIKQFETTPPSYRRRYLNKFQNLMKPFLLARK